MFKILSLAIGLALSTQGHARSCDGQSRKISETVMAAINTIPYHETSYGSDVQVASTGKITHCRVNRYRGPHADEFTVVALVGIALTTGEATAYGSCRASLFRIAGNNWEWDKLYCAGLGIDIENDY